MLLACFAFVFIFVVLQQSPWAHKNVYEPIKMFSAESRPWERIPGLSNDRLQTHLEDEEASRDGVPATESSSREKEEAWQHAVPSPPASHKEEGILAEELKAEHPNTSVEIPTPATRAHPPWVTEPARKEPKRPPYSRPKNMKDRLQSILRWNRPTWEGHWPPFRDYVDKAYDPNRWEQFDMWVTV